MKISLITTKILIICHHVVPRILLIMQHGKVKAWPLVSLGFEYMPLFLEAQKEDSNMFLIQMRSRSFACKIILKLSC